MSKILKTFFPGGSDKHRSSKNVDKEDGDFSPPMDDRRKLSISRSGRMRQANKKRYSLSPELYGENLHMAERQTSMEYHVHSKSFTQQFQNSASITQSDAVDQPNLTDGISPRRASAGSKSPEEEIDTAFQIIERP